jgi:hypothetical protein
MNLTDRIMWPIAVNRNIICASAEINFRSSFKKFVNKNSPGLTVIYSRVNAKNNESHYYTILLNILWEETTLNSMKWIKERDDQLVEPIKLLEYLTKYIRERDNKSGLIILAIDRIHMLTSIKRKLLADIFSENHANRIAVILILPKVQWDFLLERESFEFEPFLQKMDNLIKDQNDLERFYAEEQQWYSFDEDDNFLESK